MRAMVLEYLMTQKDNVMNFHLGNGAYIGDINFTPSNSQDWVTMNYVYSPDAERVGRYEKLYRGGKMRAVSPHLQEVLMESHPELLNGVCCVTMGGSDIPQAPQLRQQAQPQAAPVPVEI